MKRIISTTVLVAGAMVTAACPKELPQNTPPDELLRIGLEAHSLRRWDRAIEALQRFLFQDPGHEKADTAQFLIGDSYFNKKQYLTSAGEFLRLALNRPAGPLADDSRYRACEAYYELSPRPELDQEYTQEAIDQCRSVVLLYPQSPFASEANDRVAELRDKLARKYYLNAVYYAKRRAYDSAILYLEHLLENYRGTTIEPEAMLTLYETYRKAGYVQEADQIRERLVREYPDSPEAQKIGGGSPDEAR